MGKQAQTEGAKNKANGFRSNAYQGKFIFLMLIFLF
jgi:hypothetical protein